MTASAPKMKANVLRAKELGKEGVMRACTDLLDLWHIRYHRMNSGDRMVRDEKRGKTYRIRGHQKGTPDILAHIRLASEPYNGALPAVVWIECKATGAKPKEHQLEFGRLAEANGEIHLVIDDVNVLAMWLHQMRAMRGSQ